ncbi:MAG: hypothetical protein CMP47_02910 [Rickettsiales bacterium]|nr:hypothetical protein [Rickettsiales bacterium]
MVSVLEEILESEKPKTERPDITIKIEAVTLPINSPSEKFPFKVPITFCKNVIRSVKGKRIIDIIREAKVR